LFEIVCQSVRKFKTDVIFEFVSKRKPPAESVVRASLSVFLNSVSLRK